MLLAGLAFKVAADDLVRKLLQVGYDLDIYDPAVDANKLVGVNLGYTYSQLPMIEQILISRAKAESTPYARAIAANTTVAGLDLPAGMPVRDLNAL